ALVLPRRSTAKGSAAHWLRGRWERWRGVACDPPGVRLSSMVAERSRMCGGLVHLPLDEQRSDTVKYGLQPGVELLAIVIAWLEDVLDRQLEQVGELGGGKCLHDGPRHG